MVYYPTAILCGDVEMLGYWGKPLKSNQKKPKICCCGVIVAASEYSGNEYMPLQETLQYATQIPSLLSFIFYRPLIWNHLLWGNCGYHTGAV